MEHELQLGVIWGCFYNEIVYIDMPEESKMEDIKIYVKGTNEIYWMDIHPSLVTTAIHLGKIVCRK